MGVKGVFAFRVTIYTYIQFAGRVAQREDDHVAMGQDPQNSRVDQLQVRSDVRGEDKVLGAHLLHWL